MKIIAYIAAAILIFFGVLFIWGAGGAQGGGWTWVCGGALSVLFGFGLIWFASQRMAKAGDTNVTLQVDLPGQDPDRADDLQELRRRPKGRERQNDRRRAHRGMSLLWDDLPAGRRTQVVGRPQGEPHASKNSHSPDRDRDCGAAGRAGIRPVL